MATDHPVKFINGLKGRRIVGLAIPYGGHLGGLDAQGQAFSDRTRFHEEWFKERPVLLDHGLSGAGATVVGRVVSWQRTKEGIVATCELDEKGPYYNEILTEMAAGKLFFSSGAMAHLVQIDHSTGRIQEWPWVELSLTKSPANRLATVEFSAAKSHFLAAKMNWQPPAHLRHFYLKKVNPAAIPADALKWAVDAVSDVIAERRGIALLGMSIAWLLPEDLEDGWERLECERESKPVPWRSFVLEHEVMGFFLPKEPKLIFLRGDLSEESTRLAAVHETYHAWDSGEWGTQPVDKAAFDQMEKEALLYTSAYINAWRQRQEWSRQTRQQQMLTVR